MLLTYLLNHLGLEGLGPGLEDLGLALGFGILGKTVCLKFNFYVCPQLS